MKVLILTFLVICPGLIKAQKVLGIDINTTCISIEKSLHEKGYAQIEKVAGESCYDITYAGYRHVKLIVVYDQANDSVIHVKLDFCNRDANERKDIFYNLLHQFEAKYPDGEFEHWNPYPYTDYNQLWWNTMSDDIRMTYDENKLSLIIIYEAKYKPQQNSVKPSDDI